MTQFDQKFQHQQFEQALNDHKYLIAEKIMGRFYDVGLHLTASQMLERIDLEIALDEEADELAEDHNMQKDYRLSEAII